MKSRSARCPLPCRNGEESGRLRRRHPKKPDRIRSKYHVSCRKGLLPVNHGRQVLSFCSILRLTKKPGLPRNFRLECSADWDAGRYDGFRMNIKIACRLRSECWYCDFILPASASNFFTIDWQGQIRLPACLSGAFCPFHLGGRQPACVSKAKNHL